VPSRLLADGFAFRWGTLESALDKVLPSRARPS